MREASPSRPSQGEGRKMAVHGLRIVGVLVLLLAALVVLVVVLPWVAAWCLYTAFMLLLGVVLR